MEAMFKAHAADITGAGTDGDGDPSEPNDATPGEVTPTACAAGCAFNSVMRAVSMRPRTRGDATTHLKDMSCINFKPSAPKTGKIKSPVVTMSP